MNVERARNVYQVVLINVRRLELVWVRTSSIKAEAFDTRQERRTLDSAMRTSVKSQLWPIC